MTRITNTKKLILLVVLLVACLSFGPSVRLVNLQHLYSIPDDYPAWHHEAENCMSISRNFNKIRWSVADSIIIGGDEKWGIWMKPRGIVILKHHIHKKSTIKHEIIHYLRQNGVHDWKIGHCSKGA